MRVINPKMILLAREARGLTQQALSDKIDSYKSNLSRIENGDIAATPDLIESIADVTGYPVQFFYQKGNPLPVNLAYRKRQTVPSRIITPIEGQVNIMRMHAEFITAALELPLPQLPVFTIDKTTTPADAAIRLRQTWNIKSPVIESLIPLLEENGILINSFDFATPRVDSKSVLTGNGFPVIFLNASLLGDRQRFSLAFELGHLIMHTFSPVSHERDISHEANAFAAEFLMPAEAIRKDFEPGVTISLLGELKRKWKVSMIALLYRADDLGLLTANQKRYLIQQFNQLKIRRREPLELDVIPEQPRLVRSLLAGYREKTNLGIIEMAALLSLQSSEYMELYA